MKKNLSLFPDSKLPKTNLENLKKNFLTNLKSSHQKNYKRYLGSPLRYAGGKSLAVGLIVEKIPYNIQKIVSPFLGGASVEIACAKELGLEVVAYDIFDLLANYWQVQQNQPEELAKKLRQWKPTKEKYTEVKETLKKHWKKEETKQNKVELAALYWFNHNLSYGPGFLGWMSKIYENEIRYHRLLQRIENFNAGNFSVACASFEKILSQHRKDFLYLDPPYFLTGDSKMFRGIYPQRNFPVHHKDFDHRQLKDLLLEHKGGFILSYNDCSAIRDWYKDFEIVPVKWQYTLGQGETRIGENRESSKANHIKQSHEILIIQQPKIK